VLTQITALRIELEDSETNDTWEQDWVFHGAQFPSRGLSARGRCNDEGQAPTSEVAPKCQDSSTKLDSKSSKFFG
jgi:hypothetical protein